jgi:hypothetical protein
MKKILAAAAFLCLAAAPAHAAPGFAVAMVQECGPGIKQYPYQAGGVWLPFCLVDPPFLTAADIVAAGAVTRPMPPDLVNAHVLHLTVTPAAAQRLTELSYDNAEESFAATMDDEMISLTSIREPFHGTELELLVTMDDASFATLLKLLDKKP